MTEKKHARLSAPPRTPAFVARAGSAVLIAALGASACDVGDPGETDAGPVFDGGMSVIDAGLSAFDAGSLDAGPSDAGDSDGSAADVDGGPAGDGG